MLTANIPSHTKLIRELQHFYPLSEITSQLYTPYRDLSPPDGVFFAFPTGQTQESGRKQVIARTRQPTACTLLAAVLTCAKAGQACPSDNDLAAKTAFML